MAVQARFLTRIIGLAVACLFALGLLVVAWVRVQPGHGDGTETSGSGTLSWRSTEITASGAQFPVLASVDGRLYLVAETASNGGPRTTSVWSSTDGLAWQPMAKPGFDTDFIGRAAIDDGAGNLLVVGELTPSEQVTPEIWRSSAGQSFGKATLTGGPTVAEIVSVAAASGRLVALGDHNTPAQGLDAWVSTDGFSWTHVDLPGSGGYQAIGIRSWKQGFAALAYPVGGRQIVTLWISEDGSAWHKGTDVSVPGPSCFLALRDRLVILGAANDQRLMAVPAAWSSPDGVNWTESTAPTTATAVMFDLGTVADDSIVAIASSHLFSTGPLVEGSAPTMPPIAAPSVWISADGLSWRWAGDAPPFAQYLTAMAAFGPSVVIATVDRTGIPVHVADLAG